MNIEQQRKEFAGLLANYFASLYERGDVELGKESICSQPHIILVEVLDYINTELDFYPAMIKDDIRQAIYDKNPKNTPILNRVRQWLYSQVEQAYNYTRKSLNGAQDTFNSWPIMAKLFLIICALSNIPLFVSLLALVTIGQFIAVFVILALFNSLDSLINWSIKE